MHVAADFIVVVDHAPSQCYEHFFVEGPCSTYHTPGLSYRSECRACETMKSSMER